MFLFVPFVFDFGSAKKAKGLAAADDNTVSKGLAATDANSVMALCDAMGMKMVPKADTQKDVGNTRQDPTTAIFGHGGFAGGQMMHAQGIPLPGSFVQQGFVHPGQGGQQNTMTHYNMFR